MFLPGFRRETDERRHCNIMQNHGKFERRKKKNYRRGENELKSTVFSCHFMVKKQIRMWVSTTECQGTFYLKGKGEVDIDALILEWR